MEQSTHRIGVPPLDTMKGISGLDFLRGIVEGTLPAPPITETLGFTLAEIERGRVTFTYMPVFDHYNPLGSVHGGIAAALLDSVMGCCIHTTLEAGTGYTTLEIKINYVRAITQDTGPIRAEGRSLYVGRRSATAEGKIIDAKGTLLAHGTTTCLVFGI
jgi:uncharacterized protein (TIGR00369 family)